MMHSVSLMTHMCNHNVGSPLLREDACSQVDGVVKIDPSNFYRLRGSTVQASTVRAIHLILGLLGPDLPAAVKDLGQDELDGLLGHAHLAWEAAQYR